MKSIKFLFFVLLSLFFACNEKSGNNSASAENTDAEVVETVVLVDDLMQDPDAYVGKVIELEGLVTHVCKHSGKRLHLTSAATNKMVRVEATGEINQFERELEGSDVRIKGLVQKQVIDEDYLAKWENEMATKGEDHDHSEGEEESEQINNMRKRLAESGQEQLVSYWVDGTSFFEVN
jgi:hypothetical protein